VICWRRWQITVVGFGVSAAAPAPKAVLV